MVDERKYSKSPSTIILACGTLSYRQQSLERALDGIVQAGFPFVEVSCVCGYCEHIKPEEMKPSDMDALVLMAKERGLSIASIAGHIDLEFPLLGKGPEKAREGLRRLRSRIELANKIEVPIVNTGIGVADENDRDELKRFHDDFDNLLEYAGQEGVKIGLENHAGLTETAAATIALCKRMGRRSLGLNHDAGNVRFYAGMDPVADLESCAEDLKDYLIHVHIKDHAGEKGDWDFPPLGEGNVDFDGLAAIYRRIGFPGPYSLEIEFKGPESTDPTAAIIDRGVAESYRFMEEMKLGSES
jgi:sugar phosphate isomerase/epimerase